MDDGHGISRAESVTEIQERKPCASYTVLIMQQQGRRSDDHFLCDIQETTSALNLAVALLTRHKHHSPTMKKPLTELSRQLIIVCRKGVSPGPDEDGGHGEFIDGLGVEED